ncbi:myb-related protein 330-like [Vitis riparia]|uniref:myb-related protein 330-like n=1 Tax=Vitis riparia TaxID=96939 RepID=UPI00155B3B32|nr:myb-related protein 330-like [Vitis riparia]
MARPEEQRPRWTEEEDRMLFECKSRNLDLPWPNIAELAGLSRSGKSCRERWKNHLDPNVKRGNFSQEEDETIIRLHSSHENRGTDNAVKNRWNNHLKNKLIGRSTDHQNIPDPQSSTEDQPHATQLFHLNHNINPHASSSSIPSPSDDETIHHAFGGDYFAFEPTQLFHLNYNIDPNPSSSSITTPVSASQEIANPWSSFEFAYPYLPIDRETIHHSLGGNYFEFEPTQLFHLNHNIDPNASSSLIPTPVSTSQDIASPWSSSELAYIEFSGGYLPSDDEKIHHSFRGDYSEFEPTQLFHLNHNIDPKACSSSIPTLVSVSQEIVNPWSTFELAYPEFPGGYLQSYDETICHSLEGDYFEFEPTQLFHLNHNIDPNASSRSIPTSVSASEEIASLGFSLTGERVHAN